MVRKSTPPPAPILHCQMKGTRRAEGSAAAAAAESSGCAGPRTTCCGWVGKSHRLNSKTNTWKATNAPDHGGVMRGDEG